MKIPIKPHKERGFTIVELMIATSVFAVILTVITVGVLSFSNNYYKGVNLSATQNTARSALDSITQAVQFGSSTITIPSPLANYFCAGGYVFTFAINGSAYATTSDMGLYMSPMSTGVCTAIPSPPAGGKQLLSKNMRLINLAIAETSPGSGLYRVNIIVAYGSDNNLFCSPSAAGNGKCSGITNLPALWRVSDIQCRSGSGSQYCAVSKLVTTVGQRVGV
jgi:prepilin-type N-terminal cleavage/methylation domain-containing protein